MKQYITFSCNCMRILYALLFCFSSSSLCLGSATDCDCGTPWTFYLFFDKSSVSRFDYLASRTQKCHFISPKNTSTTYVSILLPVKCNFITLIPVRPRERKPVYLAYQFYRFFSMHLMNISGMEIYRPNNKGLIFK